MGRQQQSGLAEHEHVVPLDPRVRHFTDAIRRDPSDPTLYMMRASVLVGMHDYDDAIKDYDKAIGLRSVVVRNLFNHRGTAFRLKRDYRRAIDDYTEALKLLPNELA